MNNLPDIDMKEFLEIFCKTCGKIIGRAGDVDEGRAKGMRHWRLQHEILGKD